MGLRNRKISINFDLTWDLDDFDFDDTDYSKVQSKNSIKNGRFQIKSIKYLVYMYILMVIIGHDGS